MQIREALRKARGTLANSGVDSPKLDAEILLASTLSARREYLMIHPEKTLTATERRRFFALIRRRERREPVAYITGHREFYGINFLVNRSVLIPRPETETLIEAVLKKLPVTSYRLPVTIIDIGTGSGAIALTLAKHLPRATMYATDRSSAALRVARKNAARYRVKIIFKKGNLLEPMASIFRAHCQLLITTNLPYVPTGEWKTLQPEIRKYEPKSAIDGGRDGLKYYRELLQQLRSLHRHCERSRAERSNLRLLRRPTHSLRMIEGAGLLAMTTLFLEFDPEETRSLRASIKKLFPTASIEIKKDLAGRNRVMVVNLIAGRN